MPTISSRSRSQARSDVGVTVARSAERRAPAERRNRAVPVRWFPPRREAISGVGAPVVQPARAPRRTTSNPLGGPRMRPSISLLGLCLGVALGSISLPARADDDDPDTYPLPYAKRPLTLNARTLSPTVAVDVTRFVVDPKGAQRDLATSLTVQSGARFG